MHRILVVEDDQLLARTIQAILEEDLGGTVVLAHDGAAALQALATGPFDLLLLDLALPDLDGRQIAAYLHADPVHRDTPVLVVTGAVHWPVLARWQVAHYLPKPFDFWDLLHQVRLLLGLPGAQPTPPRPE